MPEHFVSRAAEEIPVPLRLVRHLQADGTERVGNFRREEITVLVSNVVWRAFEMDVNPTAALEPVSLRKARIIGLSDSRISRACDAVFTPDEQSPRHKRHTQHNQQRQRKPIPFSCHQPFAPV
jgi:hypothetical protein